MVINTQGKGRGGGSEPGEGCGVQPGGRESPTTEKSPEGEVSLPHTSIMLITVCQTRC